MGLTNVSTAISKIIHFHQNSSNKKTKREIICDEGCKPNVHTQTNQRRNMENLEIFAQKETVQNKTDPIIYCIGLLKQMHEKILDPNHP